jgi:hypothetical protein
MHTETMKKKNQKKVSEMAKKNCYGCKIDNLSQKQHMDTGCLASWFIQRDLYVGDCIDKMSSLEVLRQFKLSTDVTDDHAASLLRLLRSNAEFKRDLLEMK